MFEEDVRLDESHFGDLMTVDEFKELAEQGTLIDFDGYGMQVVNRKVAKHLDNVYPSKAGSIDFEATHILWINR